MCWYPLFVGKGTPGRLIELAGEKEVLFFTSRSLLEELHETLNKKKLVRSVVATGLSADQMLTNYRRLATLVTARQLAKPVSRDADDDAVLACAIAAHADFIISGDDDLLVLKNFAGIPIIRPAQAVEVFARG